jgi:hypothetical protein
MFLCLFAFMDCLLAFLNGAWVLLAPCDDRPDAPGLLSLLQAGQLLSMAAVVAVWQRAAVVSMLLKGGHTFLMNMGNAVQVYALAVTAAFMFLPLAMFCNIFRNAASNLTTYERSNRGVYPHFQGGNPFDRGLMLNLREFFGKFISALRWIFSPPRPLTRSFPFNRGRFRRCQLAQQTVVHEAEFGRILPRQFCGNATACLRK